MGINFLELEGKKIKEFRLQECPIECQRGEIKKNKAKPKHLLKL